MLGDDAHEAADLLCVALSTLLVAAVAVLPGVRETPVRPLLAVAVLLVGPGYALVAACYPRASVLAGRVAREGPDDPRLSGLGRLALSLAGSVAVVAAVGLFAAAFGVFGPLTVLPGVCALTLALCAVAWYRRRRVHPAVRYRPALGAARERLAAWSHGSRLDAALTVLVVVAVLAAAGGVYANSAGGPSADPTRAALLHAEDGGYVAADYPRTLAVGAPAEYTLALGNPDPAPATVTVVTVVERYGAADTTSADGSLVAPASRAELDRRTVTVPADGEALTTVTVRPETASENARLVFLVYHGAVPADPTTANADDELHLWVRVDGVSES